MKTILDIIERGEQPQYELTRKAYGETLVAEGKKDDRIVVLDADLAESTLSRFYRDDEGTSGRFFDLGIAEQNMTNVAAGLSLQGKIPWISTYAVFVAGRTWDQLRNTVCYGNLNVKFGACHGGISVGKDGPTHQSIEDIAITRVVPNMTIVIPADYHETKKAVLAGNRHIGPYFLRMGREKVPIVTDPEDPFELGKANTFLDGDDSYIVCNGIMIHMALLAAKELRDKDGLSVGVINMHTVKPIDREKLIECAKRAGSIVTAEEHSVIGGLGSACAEVLCQEHPVPMRIVGVNDRFGESGPPEELLERWGLTHAEIAESVREVVKMKNKS